MVKISQPKYLLLALRTKSITPSSSIRAVECGSSASVSSSINATAAWEISSRRSGERSSSSPAPANNPSGRSVGAGNSRSVGAFGKDFDLPAFEETLVEGLGRVHAVGIGEFDVGESFRVAGEFVAEDGDSLDRPASVKVRLQLLGRCRVVYVTDVNGPVVSFHLFFDCRKARSSRRRSSSGRGRWSASSQHHLLFNFRLHLTEALGFFFHLADSGFDRLQLWVLDSSAAIATPFAISQRLFFFLLFA